MVAGRGHRACAGTVADRSFTPVAASSRRAWRSQYRADRSIEPRRLRYPEGGTVILDLPPEKEAVFQAQARARGLSYEQWILEVAEQNVPPASIAGLQKTNPSSHRLVDTNILLRTLRP